MRELIAKFEKIYLHRDSVDSEVGARLRSLARVEIVDDKPFAHVKGELSAREFERSKRLLYVCRFPGQFFKRCPGSRPGLACCNYFVLNWGQQCDMNCSYCYLQSFINSPLLTIYSNLDDALNELRAVGVKSALGADSTGVRIGTGETVDSLSLDPLTLYSRRLIGFFRDYPGWTLEFKTKSDFVDQFLDVPHAGNVIASWSVNPQHVIDHEEHGTASLERRLTAAEKCRARGFRVSFHIDPMIWHPEWRESYARLIEAVTSRFTPADIPYMSVGALRFQPEQRAMMRERFGMNSYVTRAETFPGRDGKLRYDQNVRREMFQFILDGFRRHSADWRIFMCMESPESWLGTTGESPFKDPRMHDLFDPKVVQRIDNARL
jgi:spore photoproduct lyase